MDDFRWEQLSESISICIGGSHRFGTDAFLLEHFAGVRGIDTVCDLCAGCGIVGLLMLRRERPPACVSALEIDEDAFALMEQTCAISQLEGRFKPVLGDLRQVEEYFPAHSFRLVTCNPPYFPRSSGFLCPEQRRLHARHEGEDSCSIRDVCRVAAYLLQYGGRFCLCQRPERLGEVLSAMSDCGLEPKRLRFVQKTPESAPWLFLAEGKAGAKPGLSVSAPLYVEDGKGDYSAEMKEIYHII